MKNKKQVIKKDPLFAALDKTLADPVVFRKGKNYDLLREGLKALD